MESGAAHVDHAVPGHCGRRGIVYVVGLKDDFTVWGHWDTITIGQGQGLVVVQHRVEVLNPDGINWTVQYKPDVFTCTDGQSYHQL